MGLEGKLAAVASEAELWEAVQEKISAKYRYSLAIGGEPRLTKEEAAAFLRAGERVGLGAEALVLEYWTRANTEEIGPALVNAKAGLHTDGMFVDVNRGYGLQGAIDEHLKWMRDAGVAVPQPILQELSEHAKVLAEHAKANEFHGWGLMPLVEMLAAVIPPELLSETRVSTANGQVLNSLSHHFGFWDTGEAAEVGKALNVLEQHGRLSALYYELVIHNISRSFKGYRDSLAALARTWDWSPHKDDVYGKLLVALADPEIRLSTFFSGEDHLKTFSDCYSTLSASSMPSPAMARVLDAQLRQSIINYGSSRDSETLTNLLRDLLRQGKGAPDDACRSALEAVLDRELKHPALKRAVIKPKHLGRLFKLYKAFGGAIQGSQLQETASGYVKSKLFEEEAIEPADIADVVALAEQIGIGQEDAARLFREAAGSIGKAAKEYLERVPLSSWDHDLIIYRKGELVTFANRITELARRLGDREIVNGQLRQAADVMSEARFGFGIHYLSALVVEYQKAFGSSPLEVIAGVVRADILNSSLAREMKRYRAGRRGEDNPNNLYVLAHRILFGEPAPRAAEEPQRSRPQQRTGFGYRPGQQHREPPRAPPQTRQAVVVYIGSKKVDGANPNVVAELIRGLEGKVNAMVRMVSGKVPGKEGSFYGIKMSLDDFVAAVNGGFMPSAVQAVYLTSGAPESLVKDTVNFTVSEVDGGVYIQTAPTPSTFALHHLGALASALSGSKPKERKIAPHDWRLQRYFQNTRRV